MASPVKLLLKVVQPVTHAVRRYRYPGVPLDHAVTEVEAHGKVFTIERRRWSEGDLGAIEQCFVQRQYDFPLGAHGAFIQRRYDEILAAKRTPLIVDCGANIGASVLWFSSRYPAAHLVGIEPAASNFELLKTNCEGLNVDLRLAGLAAEDGVAYLTDDEGGDMSYQTSAQVNEHPVEMVSLATLLAGKPAAEYTPFLLKIDIEGGERALFDGDCASFDRFPLIYLEPHDWQSPGTLCSRGFMRFHVDRAREMCVSGENVASIAMGSDSMADSILRPKSGEG